MKDIFKHSKKCKGTAHITVGVDGVQRYVCNNCCPEGLTIIELLAKVLKTSEDEAVKTALALSHMLNISLEDAIKRLFTNHLK